jgi:hypothetical protein
MIVGKFAGELLRLNATVLQHVRGEFQGISQHSGVKAIPLQHKSTHKEHTPSQLRMS